MLVWTTLLVGCLITEVDLSGPITDTRGGGEPVAGAGVVVRDSNGTRYAETTTDDAGEFSVPVLAGQVFYLEAGAVDAGFAPTSYTGAAGTEPLSVSEGDLWLRRSADLEAIRAEFAGCSPEELGGGVGVVEGEVRLYVAPQQEVDSLPLVTTASVTAYSNNGTAYTACYLDDAGESAPDLEWTGETGRFAVFGVQEGPVSVLVEYDYGGTEPHADWFTFFVPAGGVVPLYPALAGMP